MAVTYGVTSTGFVLKRQSDISSEIQTALQNALGGNINLLPVAVFGQIVGIFSEREALVWELMQAVYTSQYPSGAEGASVDNILALNNLRRLLPTATKTAPTNTLGVNGLELYGSPGTTIPASSIISVAGNSLVQFTTDQNITIASPVNAIQSLTNYGGLPLTGSFQFQVTRQDGAVLTSVPLLATAQDTVAMLTVPSTPTSGYFYLGVGGQHTGQIPYSATAATIQTAVQALTGYGSATVTGSWATGYSLVFGQPTPLLNTNATLISYSATPSGGTLLMSLNGQNLSSLAYNATAAQVQAAINGIVGFERVTVTGSATATTGFIVNWIDQAAGTFIVLINPSGATVTAGAAATLNVAVTPVNSLQAAIEGMYDTQALNYPYTDVTVTGSFASSLFTITFGGGAVLGSNPASGGQVQQLLLPINDSLQNSSTVINLNTETIQAGRAAVGIGSATCTTTGPNAAPAGTLTVIGSPVSGWTAVNNPLDCITGTNLETDSDALARRTALLSANASGTVTAIADKVGQLTGVVQALGFENITGAAQQNIAFVGTVTGGSFTLSLLGSTNSYQTTAAIPYTALSNIQQITFVGTPTAGSFTITLGVQTTTAIAYNATSLQVQAAVQALTGFSTVIVTGTFSTGFLFVFNNLSQPPIAVTSSLTGSTPTAIPSVQAFINALPSYGPVLVTGSISAGMAINFNGSAGSQQQKLIVATNSLTGISAINVTYGRPGHSFEIVVNDNNGEVDNTTIATTIFNNKPAGIQSYGTTTASILDNAGNAYAVSFSRPTQVPIYVVVILQTDLTTSTSPKFNPASILAIQEDLVNIGKAFPIGGLIIGRGSNGLIGAFNSVPGINSYSLSFGTAPNPVSDSNIQLQPEQVALFETFLITVSYT